MERVPGEPVPDERVRDERVRDERVRDERELVGRLAAEGLAAAPWSNGPGDRYAAHRHGYDKVLVVARGSIVFGVAGVGAVALAEGDRLDLPAGTEHDAVVGASGVTCLEAHLPAGTLPSPTRTDAGRW